MNVNLFVIEDYENEPPSGPKKTNPKQSQSPRGQNELKIACRKIRPHLYFLRNHLLLVISGDLGYIIKLGFIREVIK